MTNLKQVRILNDSIQLEITPFTTVLSGVATAWMREKVPDKESWSTSHLVFTGVISRIWDAKKIGENPLADGFMYFWELRTGDMEKDWKAFLGLVPSKALPDLVNVINLVTVPLPSPSEELQNIPPSDSADPLQ